MAPRRTTHVSAIELGARIGLLTGVAGLVLAIVAVALLIVQHQFGGGAIGWSRRALGLLFLAALAMALASSALTAAGAMWRSGVAPRPTLRLASALGGVGLVVAVMAILQACLDLTGTTVPLRVAMAAATVGVAVAAIANISGLQAPGGAASVLRRFAMTAAAFAGATAVGLSFLLGIADPNATLARTSLLEATQIGLSIALPASSLIALLCVKAVAALTDPKALPRESISADAALDLDCPMCGERQMIAQGFARCSACRFPMRIEIQEPRCACGYLLFRIEGDHCPECGRTLPRVTPT